MGEETIITESTETMIEAETKVAEDDSHIEQEWLIGDGGSSMIETDNGFIGQEEIITK